MKHSIAFFSFLSLLATACGATAPDAEAPAGESAPGTSQQDLSANKLAPLFGLERFSLLSFTDIKDLTHVEGPMAAARDIVLSSYTINDVALVEPALVVGRDVNLGVGTVAGSQNGKILYGGKLLKYWYGAPSKVSDPMREVNFKVFKDAASFASADLASRAQTGTISVASSPTADVYSLVGNLPLNIFTLDAALLNDSADRVQLNVTIPAASTVVFNVAGASVDANRFDITGVEAKQVVWNFPAATSINVHEIAFQGTLLAPNAAFGFWNGELRGGVIVNDVPGDGNPTGVIHYAPFTGNLHINTPSCQFDFYNAQDKTQLHPTLDGTSCRVRSLPAGITHGPLISVQGTDVYSQRKYCPANGQFDSANCFMYAVPAGTKAFLYANKFYYTRHTTGAACDPGAYFDSQNCYLGDVPAGFTPFIYDNKHYVQPNAGCLVGEDQGNRCYIGTTPDSTTPFVSGGFLYYSE